MFARVIAVVLAGAAPLACLTGPSDTSDSSGGRERREYVDPQGRFSFEYPADFGSPSAGTNDGFGDRVAAVRFLSEPYSSFQIVRGGTAPASGTLSDMQAMAASWRAR